MQVAGLDAALKMPAAHSPARSCALARLRAPLLGAAVLAVALIAFTAMHAILAEVHYRDIRHAVAAVGRERIAVALLLTAISYLALTLYDWLALRTIGRPLPWRTAALASFTSYAVSNNLGFALLTGGSARLRAYGAAGLDFGDVARITLIASATFWSGIATVTGAALLLAHAPFALGPFAFGVATQRAIGVAILAAIAALLVLRARGLAEVRVGGATLPLPSAPLIAMQIAVAALDLLCAAGALFVLVPGAPPALFGGFFLAYAVAIFAGLVTHVPGGLGVIEATMLALVPLGRADLFAGLLLYRLVYYLLPLALAGAISAGVEGRRLHRPLRAGLGAIDRVGQALAPPLLALLVFAGGLTLLVSGALPGLHDRLTSLRGVLPLPSVELSHFSASLVGTALLLIAPAVQARLRSGLHAARALLLAGALFSLLKGIDYEEAAMLLGVAALLHYSRDGFYRSAGIGAAPIARWWWAAALIALALSAWAGFFAYQHIPYSDEMWWDFAWRGNASRFLRATLGATMLVAGWAFWRILAAPPAVAQPRELPDEVAERALAAASRADAMLAYTGDKSFLVSAAGDAFLMFRVQGRTWVVMGDPVGPAAAWPELIWELRRRCDAARGRLCLFQVSAEMLPLVVELGLQPMKYGEEAVVDLSHGFALEGSAYKSLRHSTRKAVVSGLCFEVLPAAEVRANADALARVSDAWLAGKVGPEKGFSLGRFDIDYLARFDCAVLRLGGEVVAFANLWATPNREELSVDLMRHLPDTPYGAMDLLFVRLMQWGAERGYRRFNLGMAPLSGLHGGPLAPLWSRLGAAVYGHGERLYGFSGLRAFKAKYAPVWVPRYVGISPGISVPRALVDLAQLVGG